MKRAIYSIVFVSLIVISFFFGRQTVFKEGELAKQANGLLAYQAYYEATEEIMSSQSDTLLTPLYKESKEFIKNYHNSVPMVWPEIIDQRDQLSDVIRCFYDDNVECQAKLEDLLVNFTGRTIDDLKNWCYAY